MPSDAMLNSIDTAVAECERLHERVRALEIHSAQLQRQLDEARAERDFFREKYRAYRAFSDADIEAFIDEVKRYPEGWISSEQFMAEIAQLEREGGSEVSS